VPKGIKVQVGDVVEIHSGSQGDLKNPSGPVNLLVGVRERQNDFGSQCRWDPPNPVFRRRILYYDWMESEGWTREQVQSFQCWKKLSK
jgi:hypothetical protein